MKRLTLAVLVIVMAQIANSQTVFEGLKMSQNDIMGSARYMGVGGAFSALGGDVTSIKDNPAGLGIFRKSELAGTLNLQIQSSNAYWGQIKTIDGKTSVGMDNIVLVLAGKTWRAESGYSGLQSSNFSFSYNKLKNFNRQIAISNKNFNQSMTDYFGAIAGKTLPADLKYNDNSNFDPSELYGSEKLSWLEVMASYGRLIKPVYNGSTFINWESLLEPNETVTPTYTLNETGGINEYSFGWSGNFSNKFYLGATLNLQSIDYQSESSYKEVFGIVGNMKLVNNLVTTGSGVSLNAGAIIVPVDFIRIGFAIHSPMYYNLKQLNYATLDFATDVQGSTSTPTNNVVNYYLKTPLQLNLSTAFILDKKGFISAEYVYNNYKDMKFSDSNGYLFTDENNDIASMLQNTRTIKIGGEYKLTDNVSVRAGYANVSSLTNSNVQKIMGSTTTRTDPEFFSHNSTSYITLGGGYRESNWYVDFAFVRKIVDEDYHAFNFSNISTANVVSNSNNLLCTFGLRF